MWVCACVNHVHLGLSETIGDYLGLSGNSIWTISDYLGLSWTWVQVETGESKLLLFETFSFPLFFHTCDL